MSLPDSVFFSFTSDICMMFCELSTLLQVRERERKHLKTVSLKSHVFSVREVTIFHVRYVRARRRHTISPKWRRHLNNTMF